MAALMYRNGPVNLNYKKEVDLSPHSCNVSMFITPWFHYAQNLSHPFNLLIFWISITYDNTPLKKVAGVLVSGY